MENASGEKREPSTKKVIGDLDPDGNNSFSECQNDANICSLCLQEIQKFETASP